MGMYCLGPERYYPPKQPDGTPNDYGQYHEEIWDLEKFSKRELRKDYYRVCALRYNMRKGFAHRTRHNVYMGVIRGFLSIEDAEIILKNLRRAFYFTNFLERKAVRERDKRFLEFQRNKREKQIQEQ